MSETAPKTLRQLIALGSDFLARKQIDNPRVGCELLAAHLYQCGRLELVQHLDQVPTAAHVAALRRGLQRVAQGEPVQYVLGEWDFRALTLKVDKRALVPRPETEELVGLVVAHCRAHPRAKPLIVDMGTGSGCIILSLAHELTEGVFVGLDICPEALALARENAVFTGLQARVMFALSDGCGEFDPASIDILISNPPYIASAEVDTLPTHIRDHEPRVALDGGQDGLAIIRALLLDAVMVLKPQGKIFLEIGYDQGAILSELLAEFGFTEIQIHPDSAGRDRFASATLAI